MTDNRLVLRHKGTGKIASRRDHLNKALALESQRLTDVGHGGGLTTLLLPNSPKEKTNLNKIAEIYTVCWVKPRRSSQSGLGDRKQLQLALADDDFIVKLLVLFVEHTKNKPGPQGTSAKAFTRWLKTQLKKPSSAAAKVVRADYEVLHYVERGERWWADAFAQRRKRRVKESTS